MALRLGVSKWATPCALCILPMRCIEIACSRQGRFPRGSCPIQSHPANANLFVFNPSSLAMFQLPSAALLASVLASAWAIRSRTSLEADDEATGTSSAMCNASDVEMWYLLETGSLSEKASDLDSHQFLQQLGTGVKPAALMACFNKHRKEESAEMTWKQSIRETLITGMNSAFHGRAKSGIYKMLKFGLKLKGGGADRLLQWAFEHTEGRNPFCSSVKEDRMETHAVVDRLGTALTSGGADEMEHAEVQDAELARFQEKLTEIVQRSVSGLLTADCTGPNTMSEPRPLEWPDESLPPVVRRTFELLQAAPRTSREYYYASQLISIFLDYTKLMKLDLTNIEMPPEAQKMWDMLGSVANAELSTPFYEHAKAAIKEGSADIQIANNSCNCEQISAVTAKALADTMAAVGFEVDKTEGDWAWQLTDRSKMTDLLTLTELGIEDPEVSLLNIMGEMNRMPKVTKQRAIVKFILVGMPIVQNYFAHLQTKQGTDPASLEAYHKKLTWFLFINILWAVFHEAEEADLGDALHGPSLKFRQENVALGLLTAAMAVLTKFSWDGAMLKMENSAAFNDWNVALYTVWNYRFVSALFRQDRRHFHLWHALGLPIVESIGNHGTADYWINYRRDGLYTAMIAMQDMPDPDEARR